MTQRRLFIGAIALTFAIGGLLIVATNSSGILADAVNSAALNPDNCATPAYKNKHDECKKTQRFIAITYTDDNGNGVQDVDEKFAPGIVVYAKKGSGNQTQKTTNAQGRAHFNSMALGSYTVSVATSDSYEVTTKHPESAKVVKGKLNFVYFGIKMKDGTTPTPTPSGSPGATPSPVVKAPKYHFVSLPVNANKSYNKTYANLVPFEGNILKLDQLPELAGKNKFFKSVLSGVTDSKQVRWDSYSLVHGKVSVPGRTKSAAPIKGKEGGNITENYVVSRCLAADAEQPMSWKNFGFTMKAQTSGQLRVYYRVINECPNEDMAGGEWTRLDISSKFTQGVSLPWVPGMPDTEASTDSLVSRVTQGFRPLNYKTSVNKTGKYFQYKIHIKNPAAFIHTISLNAEPTGGGSTSSPTPTPSGTVTPKIPSESPSAGPAGEGKIFIQTKKLVINGQGASPTPSASGGPLLPTGSPKAASPSPSSDANTVNPLCYGNQETEEAANVKLPLIKASKSGGVKIEDEQTDEDGEWTGLNGEEDDFPVDTYQITFGDYDPAVYQIVAFCDPDNNHIIRSQSDPRTKKATIRVKNGETSRLIALYGPRTLPYIEMKKYAIPGDAVTGIAQKVINFIYPGQKFNYLIVYTNTNTSGEVAKNVVIRDVIPEEYTVDHSQPDIPGGKIELQPDPRGGTLVTATVGDVAAQATGQIQIRVTLKPDAFSADTTDPDGILAPE